MKPIKEKFLKLNESSLIEEINKIGGATARFNKPLIIKSIGDDCAIFKDSNNLLVSADSITENVHFTLEDYSFHEIGEKSLFVNLSDIAAMGGIPRLFILSLFIPDYINRDSINELLGGITAASKRFKVSLIGGNISKASELSIAITIIGDYLKDFAVGRNCSSNGENIYVSGELGNSWLSYCLRNKLKKSDNINLINSERRLIEDLIKNNKLPVPRIGLGRYLAEKKLANSMTDISDGILKDVGNLTTSRNGAEIWIDRLPFNKDLRKIADLFSIEDYLDNIVSFGEDYELLWTGSDSNDSKLMEYSKNKRIKITKIGQITDRPNEVKFVNYATGDEIVMLDRTFKHL